MAECSNLIRNLPPRFWVEQKAATFLKPRLFSFNEELASGLGLNFESDERKARLFSGQELLPGSKPVACVYAGHQFGHFVPQLGDGRALTLGELVDVDGGLFELQLKGSGPTPFSRRGDGFCSLGPAIREFLVSETMYRLGVPTGRSLAIVETGGLVYREQAFPGAILTRVASSHLRIGTLEYFLSRNDMAGLRAIVDFAIDRHYPELKSSDHKYFDFFVAVSRRTLGLVAQWMSLGFVHGVMNTDNMSLSGETIDYGPCAFVDQFRWDAVFSSIDRQGRYAYKNQPDIALWNLSSLARCVAPLIELKSESELTREFEKCFGELSDFFQQEFLKRMLCKLGISTVDEGDERLVYLFLDYLQKHQLHFTQSFYFLHELLGEDSSSHFPDSIELREFLSLWRSRVHQEGKDRAVLLMQQSNPALIPQNHLIERAIEKSLEGDRQFFFELYSALEEPFCFHDPFSLAPKEAERVSETFCGT